MDKRGISVIIGSILLILIVVSLFSVVIFFIKKNSEKAIKQGSESFEKIFDCNDIDLEIEKGCFQATYESSSDKWRNEAVGIMIKNNKNFNINAFSIKYSSGESDIGVGGSTAELGNYEAQYITIKIPSNSDWNDWRNKDYWIKLYPIINGQTCNLNEHKINIKGFFYEDC